MSEANIISLTLVIGFVLYWAQAWWLPTVKELFFGLRCAIASQIGKMDSRSGKLKDRYMAKPSLREYYLHGFSSSSIEKIKNKQLK